MPPKRPTAKATQKAPSRVSARIAASHEETINAELTDADDSHRDDEDSNHDDKEAPSGILSSGPNASAPVPSVPSELATTQGRTAYDVRYFFNLPDKTCYRCKDHHEANPTLQKWKYDYKPGQGYQGLRGHIERYHEDEYIKACQDNGWRIMLPSWLKKEKAAREVALQDLPAARTAFTSEKFLQHLIDWIISDDQSLRVVEIPEFRRLLLLLRDELDDNDIPRRTKIRSAVMESLDDFFVKLKNDIQNSLGKVSFTADLWSDSKLQSFLAITAHWIARNGNNLELKSSLIAFHRVWGRHTGKNLAAIILSLLDRAGATSKVGHFTLDNAANNKTTMKELKKLLAEREIPFSSENNRIMCFPHVVNIATQRILQALTNPNLMGDDSEDNNDDTDQGGELADGEDGEDGEEGEEGEEGDGEDGEDEDSEEDDDDEEEDQGNNTMRRGASTYEAACQEDPINLCRKIARAVRSSGQRRDEFDEMITNGNTKGWFQVDGQVVQVSQLQLLLDVKTRWDSTFTMLKRIIELQPAVERLVSKDVYELLHLRLSEQEWEVLGDFALILSFPNDFQQALTSERTPMLAGVLPSFEMLMTRWEKLAKDMPHLRKYIQPGLDSAYKYYSRMDETKAYVVAMFVNPNVRLAWIQENWGSEDPHYKKALKTIKKLMTTYQGSAPEKRSLKKNIPPSPAKHLNKWQQIVNKYDNQLGFRPTFAATEADQNIEDEFISYTTSRVVQTDILQFWQANERTYPTIFKIAMDFLPIQASAVPCERVFSSSSETDSKKRNRLAFDIMEALQIRKYGLKFDRLDFVKHWVTPVTDLAADNEDDDVDARNVQVKL